MNEKPSDRDIRLEMAKEIEKLRAENANYKEVLERIATQLLLRGKMIKLAEEALAWRYK